MQGETGAMLCQWFLGKGLPRCGNGERGRKGQKAKREGLDEAREGVPVIAGRSEAQAAPWPLMVA